MLAKLGFGMFVSCRPVFLMTLAFLWFSTAACDDESSHQGVPPAVKKKPVKATATQPVASSSAAPTPVVASGQATQDTDGATGRVQLMKKAAEDLKRKAPKKAMISLRQVTETHPTYAEAYLKLAALLGAEGKQAEATRVLEAGIAKASDRHGLLEEAARIQARAGQSQKGSEYISRILEKDPSMTDVRLRYAQLLTKLGDWESAYAEFVALQPVITLKPKDVVSLASVMHRLGKQEEALTLLRCSEEDATPPRTAGAELRCGALRTDRNELLQADKHLKLAQALVTNDRTHFFLGENEFARGRYDEAARHFVQAGSLNDKRNDWKIGHAKALRAMGGTHNLGKAMRILSLIVDAYGRFRTPVELRSRDPQVFRERAEIYLQLKEDKRALADLDSGLALAPASISLRIAKAKALYYSRRTKKAMALLKTLLQDEPRVPEANFFLARMHLASMQTGPAIKFFELSLKYGDKRFKQAHEAHSSLINLYKERNQQRRVCDHLKRYLKVAPRSATDRVDVAEELRRNCR
jgi:tetratricopeptide (TPR) repeat protein